MKVPLVRYSPVVYSREETYRYVLFRELISDARRSITKVMDQLREALDKMWIQIPSICGLEQFAGEGAEICRLRSNEERMRLAH